MNWLVIAILENMNSQFNYEPMTQPRQDNRLE